MVTLSKPKEKGSVDKLLWSTEYAFVSHYTVDECIVHLNALNAKYRKDDLSFWESNRFDIGGLIDNGGVVQFEVEGSATKQMIKVRSMGQLIYKDHNKTLIRMQIGITRQSVLWELITTAIICLVFALAYMSIGALIFMLFMMVIFHLITYAVFLSLRSNIRASVYEALSKPAAPRPTTLPR